MYRFFITLIGCFISGCVTTVVPTGSADRIFHDDLFEAASTPVHAEDALTVSDAMRHYAQDQLLHSMDGVNRNDVRTLFVRKTYQKGELKLDYDASQTRTAAQAFESKSGNCLSLVLLTSAMAKEIGLSVQYQSVVVKPDWNRKNNFFVSIDHVNLVISDPLARVISWPREITIDFLPSEVAQAMETTTIDEKTVLAMYSNNRAIESLMDGKINDSYWWARESLRQDSNFPNAYITLGVIFREISRADLSEQVLSQLADLAPDNTAMLANRILVLRELGKIQEAEKLADRLARLDPHPPMSYFKQAQKEMVEGHFEIAKRLFEKEIERDPDRQEYEFGLALAYFKLRDNVHAYQHMYRAFELSTNLPVHDLYKAKLEKLKSLGVQ